MSEIRVPYGPQKKTGVERIADFMNGFLGVEMLETIPCPDHLQCEFDDLDGDGKLEWLEYTFSVVFRDAALEAAGLLGRELSLVELNLIKRRIINYFEQSGIECDY